MIRGIYPWQGRCWTIERGYHNPVWPDHIRRIVMTPKDGPKDGPKSGKSADDKKEPKP